MNLNARRLTLLILLLLVASFTSVGVLTAPDRVSKVHTQVRQGYVLADSIAPHVWWHPGLVNGSVFVGEKNLTVIAGDSESGIARVEFYRDGVIVSNQTISPPSSPGVDNSYTYTWDTTTVTNANYTFVVKVFDVAGNQDQVTIEVTVLNITTPTTPTTTTGPPPPDLLLVAAAAGGAALLTFVLYYYFVIQRKEKG